MNELIIYLDKRNYNKTKIIEKFSFIIVGATLLLSAYNGLMRPSQNRTFIDILFLSVSLIAGLLNIVFAIMLNKIKNEKMRITFYRFILGISGILLIIDGIDKSTQGSQLIQYLLMFTGFLYFSVALFYNDMQKRKLVKINDEGILLGKSFFKQRSFKWNEINSIQFDNKQLILSLNNKKQYSIKLLLKENEALNEFKTSLNEETSKRKIQLLI